MSTQDPHKHPLYRPHHGDMTGWRYLEVGEVRNRGDEFDWKEQGDGWNPLMYRMGEIYTAEEMNMFTYRRRVTAESKPVEQKRFVTVICEMNKAVDLKSALAKSELHVLDIREGNALALLDGIEERVVKAIREEQAK